MFKPILETEANGKRIEDVKQVGLHLIKTLSQKQETTEMFKLTTGKLYCSTL